VFYPSEKKGKRGREKTVLLSGEKRPPLTRFRGREKKEREDRLEIEVARGRPHRWSGQVGGGGKKDFIKRMARRTAKGESSCIVQYHKGKVRGICLWKERHSFWGLVREEENVVISGEG